MSSRAQILSQVREHQANASRGKIRALDPHDYWQDHQSLAVLDSLNLTGGRPNWKQQQIDRLHDWASAHEKKPNSVESQLEFVGYQLLNTHEGIGWNLHQARTYESAKEAIAPYIKLITEGRPDTEEDNSN